MTAGRSRKEAGKATGLGPEGQQGYAPVTAPEPGCARLCVSPRQCMHVINPEENTHTYPEFWVFQTRKIVFKLK